MVTTELKKPISHSFNLSNNARFADFAGWQMPTFYSSILDEHKACREHIALFDVSHMGRWWVTGQEAQDYLNYLITNDLRNLAEGRALYTAMLNEAGGIIDDLVIYKINPERFLLVNNAGNHSIDSEWYYKQINNFKVELEDISKSWGQIAVQGPAAKASLEKILRLESSLKYFSFKELQYENENLVLAATGYTGELGYEIYGKPEILMKIWQELIDSYQAVPAGLGARDILRLEAGYCLHGNDIDTSTSPYEAGLEWVTKLDDHEFIGKANATRKEKKLIGLLFPEAEKLIARAHTKIMDKNGQEIGEITSGNFSPCLNRAIALAYLDTNYNSETAYLELRSKKYQAKICQPWFYRNIKGLEKQT